MNYTEGLGMLALYSDRLVLNCDGRSTEIPFHAVRKLSLASYPFWLSPAGCVDPWWSSRKRGKLAG